MKNLIRQYFREGGEGEDISDSTVGSLPAEEANLKVNKLIELVYGTDPFSKALTGRTPERIEQETGIPKNQMFPENAKILYVGDPWQRMGKAIDKPNLTIIDYEFGDVVSFVTDNEEFRHRIDMKTQYLLSEISYLKESGQTDEAQISWINQFEQLAVLAKTLSDIANSQEDYKKAEHAWGIAKEFVEMQYKKDAENIDETKSGDPGSQIDEYDIFSSFRKEAWYTCIYGERGFKDIPDFLNIIVPKMNEKRRQLLLEGVVEEDAVKVVGRLTRSWIEELRLKKIPQKANVVEAVFPALPFQNRSFDRFIASWSISAHTFGVLDREEFGKYWLEIYRVLNKSGEAYIFPLHYSHVDIDALESSLKEFSSHHNCEWKYLDHEGQSTTSFESAETLWLKK